MNSSTPGGAPDWAPEPNAERIPFSRHFAVGGSVVRATLAPHERADGRGVSRELAALVFEDPRGVWIHPVAASATLDSFNDSELSDLLVRAVRRG